jgi:hypothetical protein
MLHEERAKTGAHKTIEKKKIISTLKMSTVSKSLQPFQFFGSSALQDIL